MTRQQMQAIRSMNVLEVSDLDASKKHFAKLNFNETGHWPEYKVSIVQRGHVTFLLQEIEGKASSNKGWAAYVYVADIKSLHDEFARNGIENLMQISERPWAVGEFAVRDHDGHEIAFGQSSDLDQQPGPGLAKIG